MEGMRSIPGDSLHLAIFIAVFLWAFLPEFRLVARSRRAHGAAAALDRGSLQWITRLGGLAWLIALGAVVFLPRFDILSHREAAFWAGIGLLWLGSLGRRWCWRTLGGWFTGTVAVSDGQRVVSTGPYRLIRHPSYSAAMVMYVGIGLCMRNWLSLAAMIVLPLTSYAYRIAVEERALMEELGSPYEEYMRRTKRLVPWTL
jgi:protein-S-isoprenylcysteine O-methyltransferase Ste14